MNHLGSFSPKAATDILNKTVIVIATYGLTMTDVEWVDKEALRHLAADWPTSGTLKKRPLTSG